MRTGEGRWYPGLCSDVLDGCQLGTGGKHIYPIQQQIYMYMYRYSVFSVKKSSVDIVNVIGKLIICEGFNVFMTEKVLDRSLFE